MAGCGKGVPVIGYPADGEKIYLDRTPYFQVTLADVNAYQDTTIEVRGAEQFGGDLTCQPGNQQAALCSSRLMNSFGGGFNQTCVADRPCTLVIIARRADQVDVRTVSVIRYSGQTTTPQQQQPR
jgi:hypothetical protein